MADHFVSSQPPYLGAQADAIAGNLRWIENTAVRNRPVRMASLTSVGTEASARVKCEIYRQDDCCFGKGSSSRDIPEEVRLLHQVSGSPLG